ncbi:MAG: N-acetylmuramoyl-L-alanine amidase [Acidimicrobiia bacterium]
MSSVYIQIAHYDRKRGATGTAGHRGTEQAYSYAVSYRVAWLLGAMGHEVRIHKADDPVTKTDAFIALHQDGSIHDSANGASVGYRDTRSKELAFNMKAAYQFVGFPSGFRPDNYTSALQFYYGTGRALAAGTSYAVIMEMGFATNWRDEEWMWNHMDNTALAIANAILITLGEDAINTNPEKPQIPEIPPEEVPAPADLRYCRVDLPRRHTNGRAYERTIEFFNLNPAAENVDAMVARQLKRVQRLSGQKRTGKLDAATWKALHDLNALRRVCE